MTDPTLHPALARIAAAYDQVIADLTTGRISERTAREQIAALEARDDDGVRWSIDPNTGQWVRRTAFGDAEFDPHPPTHGFALPDAFDIDPNLTAFDPRDRLTYQGVAPPTPSPGALRGATRLPDLTPPPARPGSLRAQWADLPWGTQALLVVALAALTFAGVRACEPADTQPFEPMPTVSPA